MKVIIAGDFAPRARLAKHVESRRFSEIFPKNLVNVIKSADYSIVNFESAIIDSTFKPIKKCGPNLSCTPDAADAVAYAGFKAVSMANNHILDFGVEGLKKSIECCKKAGLDIVGVGDNLTNAEKTLYIKHEGKKLAIINCCEHEFSIATDNFAGANPLNPVRQYYCIQEARKNADYVLVIVHGGHEHYNLPSPRMQETYRFFIDAGADAVVNHHQHCYSGYELYNGKPIFYGIGNFCFDYIGIPSKQWTEGYLVEIDFNSQISFRIHPYTQFGIDNENVSLQRFDSYNEDLYRLNNIIKDPQLVKDSANKYYDESMKSISYFLEPMGNRYLRALQTRGWLPRLVDSRSLPRIANVVNCESHRDKLSYYLFYELNK